MTPQLQETIYEVLSAGVTADVYDYVPDGAAVPYVRIGEETCIEWDTDDANGFEVTVTVHSWSRYAGMLELKNMMMEVYRVLHNQPLVVEGYHVVLCRQEYSDSMTEDDGLTRHGVQRFRVLMHEYETST
jgi:hypothetical protein